MPQPKYDSSSGVWFRDDIANIMLALTATVAVMPAANFRTGYVAGLIALATAIGIDERTIVELRQYCTGAATERPHGGIDFSDRREQ